MVARTQKEIRQRAPLWLLGLLALNFALMSIDARDAVTKQRLVRVWVQAAMAPPAQVITSGGNTLGGFLSYILQLNRAARENRDLKQKLTDMELQLRDSRATSDENERLKSLLKLQESVKYSIVPATVVARDPSAWFDTITINRGTLQGIALNMPVATNEGIVGRVVTVSPWTSQVMLITDDRAAAGAMVGQLGSSNALGSVRGEGRNGLLEMRYVSGMEPVHQGDYVVTTGQDGIYPAGLSVGEVVEVKTGTATTPHEIHVKPSARVDSLEQVAVLLYHPPQRVSTGKSLVPSNEKGKK